MDSTARREVLTLLTSIFLIAACGLIYELLIATVSSYLLGSSVMQFSLSIGVFIGAMGLGSHLSAFIKTRLLSTFILIEIALAAIGAASVPLLLGTYALGATYWFALYSTLIIIGTLTGLELPVLTRMLKDYGELRTIIARALSFDYVGALLGSVLFPLLLLPYLGLARTGLVVGALNLVVAYWCAWVFRHRLPGIKVLSVGCAILGVLLLSGFAYSFRMVSWLEKHLYEDEVIFTKQTPFQRIVVTRWRDDTRLYLDGNLQFSTTDEYRYHEALVHPAMSLSPRTEKVLLLGGGDGLAVREVLKYRGIQEIVLVDIDPQMTQLGRTYPPIVQANGNALKDSRVQLVHEDAHKYLERQAQLFDVIIADLPDPNNETLAKLYSVEFYKLVKRHLSASGVFVTQATSPFFAREAFWCVARSMERAGWRVYPYHCYVPSFGDWGFMLAAPRRLPVSQAQVKVPTKYLNNSTLHEMFTLPRDIEKVDVRASTLDRPAILDYYLHNWKQWE